MGMSIPQMTEISILYAMCRQLWLLVVFNITEKPLMKLIVLDILKDANDKPKNLLFENIEGNQIVGNFIIAMISV